MPRYSGLLPELHARECTAAALRNIENVIRADDESRWQAQTSGSIVRHWQWRYPSVRCDLIDLVALR